MIRRLLRGRRGTTLIELSVAMFILGIVVLVVGQGLISMQRAVNGDDLRLQNLDEARTIMNVMSKDIRTAIPLIPGTSPFVTADGNYMLFYGALNTTAAPYRIEISVDNTNPKAPQLVEKVTKPDTGSVPPTYTKNPPKIRMVGRYVTNTSINPMFTYYDDQGNMLGSIGQPLNDNDKLAARAVDLNIAIRKSTTQSVPSTTLVNRIRLANLYYATQATPSP